VGFGGPSESSKDCQTDIRCVFGVTGGRVQGIDPPTNHLVSFKIKFGMTGNDFASVSIEPMSTKVDSTTNIKSMSIVGPQSVFKTSSVSPINAQTSSILP
jgi:hypothetical protein